MITANELRIGNFILNSNGKIEIVETLRYGLINSYDIGDEETCGEDCYNPIPLTEEWLVKMGFEIDRTGDLSIMINSAVTHLFFNKVKDFFYPMILVEAEFSGLGSNCVGLNSIQYVHQLQNLYFALTGEELIFTP